MNIFYVLAILCLACSALFGYLGANYESKKSNSEQLNRISKEFENLGQQISDLKITDNASSDLKIIDNTYQNLAKEYMKVLPVEAQNLVVEQEKNKLAEINQSNEYTAQINVVRNTLMKAVSAFTTTGAKIQFQDMSIPANLFSNTPFQLKLQISNQEFWSIHLVDREPNKIGLMFVRIFIKNGQELLTNDSIVFRWINNDRYGFSLNSDISEEARRKVFESLDSSYHPLSEADKNLEILALNLIKYMLAKAELERSNKSLQPTAFSGG